jgi:CRISPR/Cas system-associated endonuclease Cas1
MQADDSTRLAAVPIRNGVVALRGYGVRVSVDRRSLRVEDGVGRERREGRFAKAPSRLKRLLVIAQTGVVTLEALRWLSDAGAAFSSTTMRRFSRHSVPGLDDARYRRAQALIPSTEHCVPIARELLAAKVRAQLSVIDSFGLANGPRLQRSIRALDAADDLAGILRAEAQAAEMYWEAWERVSMQFARRDHAPDHWAIFGNRRSPLTLGPRNAGNPLNALLN